MFLVLACFVALATFTQLLAFTIMGERLTTRLRNLAFENIMRQDIAWFDKEENSTGAITGRSPINTLLQKGADVAKTNGLRRPSVL
jgi:ATP-binding cassette subfamily B (MDR/TAP) protein 1